MKASMLLVTNLTPPGVSDGPAGRLLAEEHGHCKSVTSLTFSPDGGAVRAERS
jgi:hypothetical protein